MIVPSTPSYRTTPEHPVVASLPFIAQAVLSVLYKHANKDTGQLNPRQESIGRQIQRSIRSVNHAIGVLRDAGIVDVTRRRRTASYTIRPPADWRFPKRCSAENCASKTAYHSPRFLTEETKGISEEKKRDDADFQPATSSSGGDGAPAAGKTSPEEQTQHPRPVCQPAAAPVPPAPTPIKPPVRPPAPPTPPKPPIRPPSPPMRPAPAAHSPEIEQQAREIVAELAPHHPTPGNIALARSVIASLIAVNGDIRAKLRASHEAWRVVWASYREGRFKPQLWRWVADDDWTEPPDTEEVRKLCKSNEAKRKSQERDEQIRIAVEKQERLKAEEAAEAARKEKEWWAKYNAACEAKKAAKAAEVAKEQSDAT